MFSGFQQLYQLTPLVREATVDPVQETAHRSAQGARPALVRLFLAAVYQSPQYSEFGELPEPYCVCAQERSQEPIGATRRQHAEPLPVRLVNTTLELTILLLE